MYSSYLKSVREKPYPDEERVKGDPARDLATIHHLCEGNLSQLQDIARVQVRQGYFAFRLVTKPKYFQPSIKTLVTVTEMLTKHKQKYTEMISNSSTMSSAAGAS